MMNLLRFVCFLVALVPAPVVSFLQPASRVPLLHSATSTTQLYGLFRRGQQEAPASGAANSPSQNATVAASILSLNHSADFASDQGIGGQGGVVYDVNNLKRNLLQETMQAYKAELWALLRQGSRQEAAITDRLASLVQASPVRTTTDSNLLDGVWCRAYVSSKQTTADDLKQQVELRASLSRDQRSRSRPAFPNLWSSRMRTYHLEELADHEDAYLEDETRLLGCVSKQQRSAITGLTRTDMRTRPVSTEWSVFGKKVLTRTEKDDAGSSMNSVLAPSLQQVLYCDVDLCILAAGDGDDQPYQVYTKNAEWLRTSQGFRNKLRSLSSWFQYVALSPVRWIRPDPSATPRQVQLSSTDEQVDAILREVKQDSARLRVLQLGGTESEQDNEAWDGTTDPFVHLSADERQEALKKMNVRQIEKAGNRRRRWSRRGEDKTVRKLLRQSKTYFRKPKDS